MISLTGSKLKVQSSKLKVKRLARSFDFLRAFFIYFFLDIILAIAHPRLSSSLYKKILFTYTNYTNTPQLHLSAINIFRILHLSAINSLKKRFLLQFSILLLCALSNSFLIKKSILYTSKLLTIIFFSYHSFLCEPFLYV